MIRLILFGLKVAVFSIVVLVISQIPVGNQRICDHVRDVVQHASVQRSVHWIAQRFDFVQGSRLARVEAEKASRADEPEHSESDKGLLSGLLKRTGKR